MEKPRDVIGGFLAMLIGAGFLLFGRELEMGTSFRMGAGYFPTILSVLMILLGVAMVVLAWRKPVQEGGLGQVPWIGIALVVVPVALFGLTLRGLGLAPVVVLVVLLSAWASRQARLRSSVPLALGMAVFCSFLFIKGLGLPLPLFGPWVSPAYWTAPPAKAPAAPAPAQ
ncbi:MAG: tripartite tricarboxylate transporter TctB family protein [Geminicoccaceae bacterium]